MLRDDDDDDDDAFRVDGPVVGCEAELSSLSLSSLVVIVPVI